MSDPRIKDLINHAVDDNAVDVQNSFSDLVIDRIRDIVDAKRAEVAAAFMSPTTPEMETKAAEIEDAVASSKTEE